jgi:hypothetical protein
MSSFFPIGELVDRYLIAVIKHEKTGENTVELNWYTDQIKDLDLKIVNEEIKMLKQAHLNIWRMESSLRTGLEDNVGLEEIGRRAIKIRDYNADRIAAKNEIAKKLNCSIIEIKREHLSQR